MKYIVCGELTPVQYRKLIDFALSFSSSFCVSSFKSVHKKELEKSYFDFFEKMEPFKTDKYKYDSLPQHYERGQNFNVYLLNEESSKFISERSSFWDWRIPFLPEDLSFFRYKKVWLNTISHEKMIIIITEDKKILSFLDDLGIEYRRDSWIIY